jgi:cation diffusion facilitator family transporter
MGDANNRKTVITAFSLAVSVVLVIIKILVAYFSNSIGVFSEALNNGLDLVTVLIAFMAVRIAVKPPDSDHTYGHGKYENLSAAIELGIISILSVYIIYRSIDRIISRDLQINLNNYVFAVLAFSIVLNLARVFILGRAARKYRSSVFEAEFLNYMSDIASSIIVILGLVFVRTGFPLADPIASIIVAAIVLVFSLRLSFKVLRNLLDHIPAEVTSKIRKVLDSVDDIKKINVLRIHEVGNIKFINIEAAIDKNIYLSRAEKVKKQVRNEIEKLFPGSRTIFELKTELSRENVISRVKEMVLDNQEIEDIHNVYIYEIEDRIDISLHIMMKNHLRLSQTEMITRYMEEEIKQKIPELRSIYIHIEDNKERKAFIDITSESKDLISKTKKAISDYIDPETCHNFTILKCGNKYNIAFHCRLNQELKIDQAHGIITSVEGLIRESISNIGDLAIHVEPSQ